MKFVNLKIILWHFPEMCLLDFKVNFLPKWTELSTNLGIEGCASYFPNRQALKGQELKRWLILPLPSSPVNHLPTFFWSILLQPVQIFLCLIHVSMLLFLHHRHSAHKFLWYIVQLPVMPSTGNRSIRQLRLKSHVGDPIHYASPLKFLCSGSFLESWV